MERPHEILGVDVDASPEEARRRYLQLVRQFPPDRDPERFREIHTAYQTFSDPLLQAQSLIRREEATRPWNDLISDARQNPPRLPVDVLLGLGNPASADDQGQRGRS